MQFFRRISSFLLRYLLLPFVAIALFRYLLLPVIFRLCWSFPVPETPTESLFAVVDHRLELMSLEFELNRLINAKSHPVNDFMIPALVAIRKGLTDFVRAIDEYTQEYSKVKDNDLKRFFNMLSQLSWTLEEVTTKGFKMREDRQKYINDLGMHALDALSTRKQWILYAHIAILADYGIKLDHNLTYFKTEQALRMGSPGVQITETYSDEYKEKDRSCLKLLQKLNSMMTDGDVLSKQAFLEVKRYDTAAQVFKVISKTGNSTEKNVDIKTAREEHQSLMAKIVDLVRGNREILGNTTGFISTAARRTKELLYEMLTKEFDLEAELDAAITATNVEVTKEHVALQKLSLNVDLRRAPDLDELAERGEL